MEVEKTNLATNNSGYKIYFGKDNEISVDCARVMAAEFYSANFYTWPGFLSDYLVIAAMGLHKTSKEIRVINFQITTNDRARYRN